MERKMKRLFNRNMLNIIQQQDKDKNRCVGILYRAMIVSGVESCRELTIVIMEYLLRGYIYKTINFLFNRHNRSHEKEYGKIRSNHSSFACLYDGFPGTYRFGIGNSRNYFASHRGHFSAYQYGWYVSAL